MEASVPLNPVITMADNENILGRRIVLDGRVYTLDACIGKGATSEVFKATSERGTLAIKMLTQEAMADTVVRERFLREGNLLRFLSHPNLVAGYEQGTLVGRAFIALEYIEGMALSQIVKEGKRVDMGFVLHVIASVLAALDYLYFDGRVSAHRDIKPGNIMVGKEGMVKLIDLGIAKSPLHVSCDLETNFLGSIHYMSPEQISDASRTDIRSDIYSLGAVFYEMCTQTRAFEGKDRQEVLAARLNNELPILPKTGIFKENRVLYRACTKILQKTLVPDCLNRFQTPAEFISAVHEAQKALGNGRKERKALFAEEARRGLFVASELAVISTLCTALAYGAFALFDAVMVG